MPRETHCNTLENMGAFLDKLTLLCGCRDTVDLEENHTCNCNIFEWVGDLTNLADVRTPSSFLASLPIHYFLIVKLGAKMEAKNSL